MTGAKAKLREEYLANADKAEAMAELFADSFARQGWLKIAESYRGLAAAWEAETMLFQPALEI